ncbi:MAG: hypothetical protein AAGJ18_30905, partial [Bacteroidota bacterium]
MKTIHLQKVLATHLSDTLPELKAIDTRLSYRKAESFIDKYNKGRKRSRWNEKHDSMMGFIVAMLRIELSKLRESNAFQYKAYWDSSNKDGLPFRTTMGQLRIKVSKYKEDDPVKKRNYNKTLQRRLKTMMDAGFILRIDREGRGNLFYRLWINPAWIAIAEEVVLPESASDMLKMPQNMPGEGEAGMPNSAKTQNADNQFFKSSESTNYTPSYESLKELSLDIKKNKKQIGNSGDKPTESLNNQENLLKVQTKRSIENTTLPSAGAEKNVIKIAKDAEILPVISSAPSDRRSLRLPRTAIDRFSYFLTKQMWKSVYNGTVNGRKLNEKEYELSLQLFQNHLNRLFERGMKKQHAYLILNRCLQIQKEQIEKGNFEMRYGPSYYLSIDPNQPQYGTFQLVFESFYQNEMVWREKYLPENAKLLVEQQAKTIVMIQIEKVQRLVEAHEFSMMERSRLVEQCLEII